MSLFSRVARDLLEGKFICNVTDHEGFEFLASRYERNGVTNADDVDNYLKRMDMRLSMTASESAYFCTFADIDDEGRKSAKVLFNDIKNIIRPMISFMDMIIRAHRDDGAICPGQKLEVNRLIGLIAERPSLRDELRNTAIMTGVSGPDDRSLLTGIIKRFRKEGFIEEVNREQHIYQFTGKIEYIQEVIEFLMANDRITEEDDEFDKRQDLP